MKFINNVLATSIMREINLLLERISYDIDCKSANRVRGFEYDTSV